MTTTRTVAVQFVAIPPQASSAPQRGLDGDRRGGAEPGHRQLGDAFAALLPAREKVSGAEHPDTMAARASLAYWTGCERAHDQLK